MKSYKVFGLGMSTAVLLFLLIASAFLVGKAYASTGCFTDTNGNVNEVAICWLKENGIVGGTTFSPNTAATRGTVAQWLFKQSQIPPSKGAILITPGNAAWTKFDSSNDTSFLFYSSNSFLNKATTGAALFTNQPAIPTVLYGRSMQLLGVQFCYTASTNASLSYVEVNTLTSTAGFATRTLQFSDSTYRTDAACRYYVLPAPVTLTAANSVSFYILVTWSAVPSPFQLSRTTFVLQATGTKAVVPSADFGDVVILSETTGAEGFPSTTAP
jgi:hypothetical protein